MQVDRPMRDTGKMISRMDKAQKSWKIPPSMLVVSNQERKMDLVHINGMISRAIVESGSITTSKERASTAGQMEENTQEAGKITNYMAKANTFGPMAENTKETMSRIKKRAREFTHGLMVRSMLVAGKMASNMGRQHLLIQQVRLEKVSGQTEKELSGQELMKA